MFPKDGRSHVMIGRPPFPLPPPGNMSGAPQDNVLPADVFPKEPRSDVMTGGPPIPLPPLRNVSGAHQDNVPSEMCSQNVHGAPS